ncbi:MAG: hypothetical protein CMJ64_03435 [Planctomycetaceae bacterium]|nr:hypothetical protein [Planctomycetaceae bacterium]
MSSCLVSIALSVVFISQAEERVEADAGLKIQAAIKQLSSSDFATRKKASQLLWKQGLAAEPQLRAALKSPDGETRLRARKILRDFDYGILPGVDPGIAGLVRDFRDGQPQQRQAAFQQLLDKEQYATTERLIRLEKQPEVRRGSLSQLVQHPKAIGEFVEQSRIDALMEAVAADQNDDWRRTVTIQLMFSPKVLQYHTEKKQLKKIIALIENEKQDAARAQMLNTLSASPAIGSVIEQRQLAMLLTALKAEPNKRLRGQLLSRMY